MRFEAILWDLDDDPDGNVQHCADRSSGYPVVFGDTGTGRHLMVVYESVDASTVYPITAYEVPRRYRR